MTPKEIGRKLVTNGAVLRLYPGHQTFLIGHWEWLATHSIFYFEAAEISESSGHILKFDQAHCPHEIGVEFLDAHEKLLAYLSPIEEVFDSDAEELRRQWQSWHPQHSEAREFIERVKQQLTAG